jgi:Transglycosylase SLT domain
MASFPHINHKTLPGLALAGLGSLFFLAASGPALAPDHDVACFPAAGAAAELTASAEETLDPGQRVLVDHLSRRFMIAGEATRRVVTVAYRAAEEVGLDPLLVLAVISVESRFNPVAESGMGAKGLMQIIPKYHRAKLLEQGGEDAVLDPEANIVVGVRILQEYVHRTGTLEAGLQYYNGARWDESAQYAQKVMSERQRLVEILRSARRARS